MARQCVRWSRISEVGEARFAETMLPQTTSMVRSVFFVLSWLQSENTNRYRYGNGGMHDKSALPVVTHFDMGKAQYADTIRRQTTFKVRLTLLCPSA